MKNSKRFFKLVESALRSSKVPFKTIEAMTKAILSQIMEEQSEFSFWALSFLFKRKEEEVWEEEEEGEDCYNST